MATYIYDAHTKEPNTWSFKLDNSFRDYYYGTSKPFNLKVKYNPTVHTVDHYTYILKTLNSLVESLVSSIIDRYAGASLFGNGESDVEDGISSEIGALQNIGTAYTVTLPTDLDILQHNLNCYTHIRKHNGALTSLTYFYYLLNLNRKMSFEELTTLCDHVSHWEKYNITNKWMSKVESRSKDLYLTGKIYQSIDLALSTYNLHRVPLDSLPPLNRILSSRENVIIYSVDRMREEVTGDIDELLNHPLLYLLFSNSNRTKFNLDDYTPQDMYLLFRYFSVSSLEDRVNLIKEYCENGGNTLIGW